MCKQGGGCFQVALQAIRGFSHRLATSGAFSWRCRGLTDGTSVLLLSPSNDNSSEDVPFPHGKCMLLKYTVPIFTFQALIFLCAFQVCSTLMFSEIHKF